MNKVMMAAFLGMALTGSTIADPWTTYDLMDRTVDWSSMALAHDSGNFVMAENGSFYRQTTFGSGAYSSYAGSMASGPAFIATGAGNAVTSQGAVGATELMTFDASNTGSTLSSTGVSLQTYDAKKRDASSLYVIGGNGSAYTGFFGPANSNNLTYATLDGSVQKTLINDISANSCGFAMDASGGLYVGDNDDGNVYYFSKLLLDSAVAGSALDITDGDFVVDFGGGGNIGSLAVDDNGVLWAAGYLQNGIVSYDTNDGSFYNWTPGFDTTHYALDTFSLGGTNYVGFLSADGSGSGSNIMYGFADAQAVPEPSSVILLVGGFGGLVWFRRRRKYFFR